MRRFMARGAVSVLSLAWLLGTAGWADGMTLTPTAIADGFTLSTFASGYPNGGVGPVGIAFPSSGGVMTTSYATGQVINFSTDTDGQSYPGNSQVGGYSAPAGLVNDAGFIYMAEQGGGRVLQLNNNGTINHVVTNLGGATGITVNPTTNHLFVSTVGDIWDVDPTTGIKTDYTATHGGAGSGADGLTFSADGKTLYAAIFGSGISSIDVATGHQNFFVPIPGSDGTALGTGSLAGNLFANTNGGQVIEINLTTLAQTLIATGGSRGDFVTVDPNGTLLLTQSDSILRLTAPAGGSFGAAPEPSSLTLASLLGMGLLGYGWRRRKA